jgi:hypothetical protein
MDRTGSANSGSDAAERPFSSGGRGSTSAVAGGYVLAQFVSKPKLNQRLTRDSHATSLPIQGLHHPAWKIDIHPLWIRSDAFRLGQIQLLNDLLGIIELPIKCLGFHKYQFPRHATALPK